MRERERGNCYGCDFVEFICVLCNAQVWDAHSFPGILISWEFEILAFDLHIHYPTLLTCCLHKPQPAHIQHPLHTHTDHRGGPLQGPTFPQAMG